jgi:phosphoglycerate kinase
MLRLAHLLQTGRLSGQRVLIRADLNVPLDNEGRIIDDTRIRASLPAMTQCLKAGAAVMVTSHLGRPREGRCRPEDSLEVVARQLSKLLGRPVPLLKNWLEGVEVAAGEIVLLENCRCNLGEKANDPELARRLAQLCDVYVNDAFATAHRREASTHGIVQHVSIACAGPLLAAESDALSKAFDHPDRPLVAVVGGAKVSSKLGLLHSLVHKVDQLIVGGGIANTFMLAAGFAVGRSLVEPKMLDEARAILELMSKRKYSLTTSPTGPQIELSPLPLPVDCIFAKYLTDAALPTVKLVTKIEPDDLILDLGPQTARHYCKLLASAATIIWNGPMGAFEWDAFAQGTETLAKAVAASPAFSLVGGGETIAALSRYHVGDKISYLSTGGGAFLEFLAGKTLPALEILAQKAQA